MKETRYFFVPNAASETQLPQDEAIHALRVLRLQSGDEMFLMDGEGMLYRAEVAMTSSKHCTYTIREALPQQKTWHGNIYIAMAPTKMMERVEWFAEKATEIGFDGLGFLNCKFSERKTIRIDRLDKIVVSAVKQSRKPWKPLLAEMLPFKDFVDKPHKGHLFIAHCYEEVPRTDFYSKLQQIPADEDVTVLIGPEGDFSIDEVRFAVSKGYESVTLGNSRLRTETAALMAVAMSNMVKRKL